MRGRTTIAGAAALVALVVGVPPAPALDLPSGRIEPALARAVAAGPAVAIMSWDREEATRAEVAAALEEAGLAAGVFHRLPIAYACVGSEADLRAMASVPGARSIVADAPLTPTLHRSVRAAFNGDPRVAWDQGIDGSGGTIAVLDTGIDGSHPDVRFGDRLDTNVRVVFSHNELLGPYEPFCEPDRYSDEFVGQMENTETVSGHGTHMASIAAGDGTASGGLQTGMAPGADLIGVGVIDAAGGAVNVAPGCDPRGYMSYAEHDSCRARLSTLGAIAGVEFVLSRFLEVPRPVKVILAAWTVDGLYDPWHPLAYAAWAPSFYGVAFVTAVGNRGPGPSDCSAAATCRINPLVAAPSVVAVAAGTRAASRPHLDGFSSRGDPAEHAFHEETFRYQPTITAPGANVTAARATVATTPFTGSHGPWGLAGSGKSVSTDPDYVSLTGTSVAAAHVAGAIMLMQQAAVEAKGCYLTVEQVHEVLEASATPMIEPRWQAGAGMIDTGLAITYAQVWPKKVFPETYLCPRR